MFTVFTEGHLCIEVPAEGFVGDLLKKASEQSTVMGASLWCTDIWMDLDNLFSDYFEPETVHHVKIQIFGWIRIACSLRTRGSASGKD
jgi:hypothetical protein